MGKNQDPAGGLEGLSALVTGGGSGIGLGCARRFVADGASVTICGRTDSRLQEGREALEAAAADGVVVNTAVCDVVDEDAVRAAVDVALAPTGRLDIIVASAGGSETIGPLTQLDAEAFSRTLELNVRGTFLTMKHGAAEMVRSGGGSFIGISSIAGALTHRWFGAYGPGKAGIEMLVQTAADERGESNVRVNAIAPGLVDTEMGEAITGHDEVRADYLAQMPIERVGTVDDIAAAARFLAGPGASWVTGQVLTVDGGHSLRRGPDFRSMLEPLFGADGLRGVVG